MERRILEAVARADLAVCAILRGAAVLLALGAALVLAVLLVRAWTGPPVHERDITSEGPEGDWTPAWHEWEEEENDVG